MGGNEDTTEGEREGDKDTHTNRDGERDMYARRKTKGERGEKDGKRGGSKKKG